MDEQARSWRVSVPETRRERARGLIGREPFAQGEALFLEGCRSVHTIGMRFAIDVALLDASLRVTRIVTLAPNRLLLPQPGGRHVLELAEGSGLEPGRRFRRPTRVPAV